MDKPEQEWEDDTHCKLCELSHAECICLAENPDPSAAEVMEAIPANTEKPNPHKCTSCDLRQAKIDAQTKIMSGLYRTIGDMAETICKMEDAFNARGDQ